MPVLGPRLVVGGTASGVGKTTVATGLMAAFRRRGLAVGAAKVGPDFIDPGYHALATGRPGRNLDPWICGPDAMAPLAGRAGEGADVLIVEGVMGLFDGSATARVAGDPVDGDLASTAQVARLLDAPVVLVLDAASASRSIAAVVHGFATFDPSLRIGGIILNQLGSDQHEHMVRDALAGLEIAVMGALHRDEALTWRDRYLGLVPVIEHPEVVRASLDRLASTIERRCDLDAIGALAASAPVRVVEAPPGAAPQVGDGRRPRIAVVGGPAFSFTYPDNLELLEQAGADLVPLDPFHDKALPEGLSGLVAGGGFPEIHAEALAANRPLLDEVHDRTQDGLVTWAECGGMLWLARTLDGTPLADAIPVNAVMTKRLTLGYRRAVLRHDGPLGPTGTELWGHEFHYSEVDHSGEAMTLQGRTGETRAGWVTPTLMASYLHLHLGAAPHLAEQFVLTCRARAGAMPARR